jgi:hypothetical protein
MIAVYEYKIGKEEEMRPIEVSSTPRESRGSDTPMVLDPRGYPPTITQLGMAPRLDTLAGKTVYLVDVRFDDGDLLLQQMQAWFAEQMPAVNTVFVRKAGVYMEDDPALFQEIREKGDAMIMAVGH